MKSEKKYLIGKFLLPLLFLCSFSVSAVVVDSGELSDVAANVGHKIEHCDDVVATGDFFESFECGDELFETRFNALDGGGMDVGDGGRYTRVPRADLVNWSSTTPPRATGPNAQACNVCHTAETIGAAGDGAGPIAFNAIRDPLATASVGSFIQRNTPHLFGMGGPQLLAEEMNADLEGIVRATLVLACVTRRDQTASLTSKGINFGSVTIDRSRFFCLTRSRIIINAEGVTDDLIVRPFQWKGNEPNIRGFARGAFHNELGMNPVELAGDDVDGDFDGVANEISIADVTAMTVYLAGQPRPSSLTELDALRDTLVAQFGAAGEAEADLLLLPDLTVAELSQIASGAETFNVLGCASCHAPSLTVNNPVFNEPSLNANYRDASFLGGQDPVASGLDPSNPISVDITSGLPDNNIFVGGAFVTSVGNFETDAAGAAIVRLYGDLKLHEMGPRLAENIDETGAGASVWMTKELWGLANTAPYLHDGRATTIEEAIIEHGGEAADSQANFAGLADADQDAVLAFLNNLVLFFVPD